MNTDEMDKAMADYTQALSLSPKYEEFYTYRGMVYAKMRDLDKAIADYTDAVRIGRPYDTRRLFSAW
jgi:tetratricopeptide (TPR) repeat protein